MMLRYFILLLLLTILSLGAPISSRSANIMLFYNESINPSAVNESFDGTIILELLDKTLSLIANNNYKESEKIINLLSRAYVPQNISKLHYETLNRLRDLVDSLYNVNIIVDEVERVLGNSSCFTNKQYEDALKNAVIEVFSAKYKLIDEGLISDYKTILKKYIKNPNIRFRLSESFDANLNRVIRQIDSLRNNIVDLINKLRECNTTGMLIIEIIQLDKTVLGSKSINIYGKVTDSQGNPVINATVKLTLIVAGYSIVNYTTTDNEGFFHGVIATPSADVILKVFPVIYKSYLKTNSSLYILATKIINRTIYKGLKTLNVTIKYVRPRIETTCPTSIKYNSTMKLNLTIRATTSLNITIFLDNKLLGNYSLIRGENLLILNFSNTSAGLHVLKFVSKAFGPYFPIKYTCTFAITRNIPNIKASINSIFVYPLNELHIYAVVENIDEKNTYIAISIDGKVVYNTTNTTVINTTLPSPITYLIQYHTIKLEVGEKDGSKSYFYYRVLGINPLGLLLSLLLVLTGFTIGLDKYVIKLPQILVNFKRMLKTRTTVNRKIRYYSSIVAEKTISASKIRSIIVRIYWFAVKTISKIIGDQKPSETLREYLAKARRALESEIYKLFERLTFIAERELYSSDKNNPDNIEEANKILKRLKDEIS